MWRIDVAQVHAMSAPSKKLETLEVLRAVAALLVVMYHLQDIAARHADFIPFDGAFAAGDRGVDLFFVLSGFIIMSTHKRDIGLPTRAARYLYKRACRIYPSVWSLTAFAALVYVQGFGGASKAAKLDGWNIVASAFLLPQHGPPLVNVTWTLTYEIFFYGLFAILIFSRILGLALLTMWQVAVIFLSFYQETFHYTAVNEYLQPICLEFGIGMLSAWLLDKPALDGMLTGTLSMVLLLAGSVSFIGGLIYEAGGSGDNLGSLRVAVFGLSSAAVIISLVAMERRGRIFAPAFAVRLGNASYAIYLVHYSVITLLLIVLLHLRVPPNNLALLICAFIAVEAGCIFHTHVDQPIQKALRRIGAGIFDPVAKPEDDTALRRVPNSPSDVMVPPHGDTASPYENHALSRRSRN